MSSPYADLPAQAFWRSAMAERDPADDPALYVPEARITPATRIFAAGSCFAQHVTRALRASGCSVIDAEPMPLQIPDAVKSRFGYGIYSARFGNIYTLRQFRQLLEEVLGRFKPAEPVWSRGGRFYDALRPGVEPEGHGSAEAVREARAEHLAAVGAALAGTDMLIFTLGLTECWEHRATGTVYPTAPETVAGQFDPEVFSFRNLTYDECIDDFVTLRGHLAEVSPDLKIVLTVSPVPLTATASGQHVLLATAHSKAVLRAVAGALADADPAVEYFPSYELVTAAHPDGHWFDANLRTVRPEAVDRVMRVFLRAHGLEARPAGDAPPAEADDLVCEEVLLEAFAR